MSNTSKYIAIHSTTSRRLQHGREVESAQFILNMINLINNEPT